MFVLLFNKIYLFASEDKCLLYTGSRQMDSLVDHSQQHSFLWMRSQPIMKPLIGRARCFILAFIFLIDLSSPWLMRSLPVFSILTQIHLRLFHHFAMQHILLLVCPILPGQGAAYPWATLVGPSLTTLLQGLVRIDCLPYQGLLNCR